MMQNRQSMRYAGTSGVCLITHNAVMISTDRAGFSLSGSLVASFAIVVMVGYLGHSILTFRQPMSITGLFRYVTGMGTGTAVAIPIVWFWKDAIDLPMALASPLASACTILVNFLLARWAIVSPRNSADRAKSSLQDRLAFPSPECTDVAV